MKIKLKKLVFISVTICLLLQSFVGFAAEIGDKKGDVLATDIVTYIEGVKVPSFNIAGRTAIIVENLNAMNLPFRVYYSNLTRTLTIFDGDKATRDYFHFADSKFDVPVGTPVLDVLHTDIETFYYGEKLESFNIGGYTCVYVTDFATLYGKYTWDEYARRVDVFRQKEETEGYISKKVASSAFSLDKTTFERSDIHVRWGSPRKSYIAKGTKGTFYTIDFSDDVKVEQYDESLESISSFTIKPELPILGTFLEGEEYNYIVTGQQNTKESNTLSVIKISAYDKSFKKKWDIPISNCNTTIPFDACNVSLTEKNRYLILHTSRSQYKDKNGLMPQTQLTVIVDKLTREVINPLDKFQSNHTSHALMGFVTADNEKIITANYSDANPIRGAFIQELDFKGNLLSTYKMFGAGGPSGANCTGAMLGGFAVSKDSYIMALSSIDHSLATDYYDTKIEGVPREERDVYIVTSNKKGGNLKTTCLTSYSGEEYTSSDPYLVELESGYYMVLWQKFSVNSAKSDTVCYAFIDKNGELVGETKKVSGQLSESCLPIEANGNVMWYTNTATGRVFYTINSDPSTHFSEINLF